MSFQAMPFLFLNMGGEMAYILEQRLQAQNVGSEKTAKVLCDIVAVMLGNRFLSELFEPQQMMTSQALRQFFEQIAHSSVMRLNEASMDKLFDLMTMAVKYQFLLCKEPSELVLVTMNHLDGMKAIFKSHPNILEHIDHANTLLMDHFGDTPLWQMAVIRSELMNFLHGSRVKVSLMLRERRQLDDGRFVLFTEGEQIELPYNAVVPGSVRYVENGALVRNEQFPVEERFKVSPDSGYQDRTMVRGTTLGQNMYNTSSNETVQEPIPSQQAAKIAEMPTAGRKNGTGEELGLLSLLISRGEKAKQADGFELSVFDDEEKEQAEIGGAGSSKKSANQQNGGTTKAKAAATTTKKEGSSSLLTKAMKEMSLEKSSGSEEHQPDEQAKKRKPGGRGNQLLDMMDREAKSKAPTSGSSKPELTRKRSGSAAAKKNAKK